MSSLNKVQLICRAGKDPEVRSLDNGAKVASFTAATTESYKDKTTGEKKQATEWHNLVLWRGVAGIAERYIKKGDLIYVEGKLKTRSWEKDGVTRYTTEVVVDNLVLLGGKSNGSPRQEEPVETGNATGSGDDSDLPF